MEKNREQWELKEYMPDEIMHDKGIREGFIFIKIQVNISKENTEDC